MATEPDIIAQFIDQMAAAGNCPASAADIKADDKWHRIKCVGEKTPNCRYQLKIEDGRGIGRWIHFRDGESHSFKPKNDKSWTPAERDAWKKKREEREKADKIEQDKEWHIAAAECARIWEAAAPAESHPYTDKKGVSPAFARVGSVTLPSGKRHDNILIMPARKNNKISSLQLIWPDGFKMFWEGGDIAGAFCAMTSKEEDKAVIIVAEGYATGRSIRDATGLPVVVAYTANNIEAVVVTLRNRYPESKIIIAADNDQWTIDNKRRDRETDYKAIPGDDPRWQEWAAKGWLINAGMAKAKQAGVKVAAHVIFPDIPAGDRDKRTDFNDLHLSDGLDAVKSRIMLSNPTHEEPAPVDEAELYPSMEIDPNTPPEWHNSPIEIYEDHNPELESLYEAKHKKNQNWMEDLKYNESGGIKGNSLNNARLYIQNHPDYEGMFCYDEFAHEKVITRCPPWEEENKFAVRTLRDEDTTHLAMHIEKHGISLNLMNLKKVLDAVIQEEKRNPAKEHLNRIKWDGIPRLDTWLREYAGVKSDDPEYVAAVGRKWLAAAVARVMNPGCKFDHILILEGSQNLGKSMMLRELATIHGRAYFDDTIKARDLASDKVVPKLQGVLIIELAEMTGFKKMDSEEAKQVISTQYDRIVKKYANEPSMMPRQFVFAGTLNRIAGYLDDPTGNRRYWPVKCTRIDIEGIKRDREQIWAEAVSVYKAGEELWLKDDLYRKAEDAQRDRAMIHPWTYEIEAVCRGQKIVTFENIWDKLQITDRIKRNKESSEIVSKIMASLGFDYGRHRDNGGERLWAFRRAEAEIVQPDIAESLGDFEEIPF